MTSVEIVRGKSFEECIENIENQYAKYEVISQREFVENWMKFWKKSCEIVFRPLELAEQKQDAEEVEMTDEEIVEAIKSVDSKENADMKEEEFLEEKNEDIEKMKLIKKLSGESVEGEVVLTAEQMKILELEKELNTLKNENKVPEDFANYYEMLKEKEIEEKTAKEIVQEVAENYSKEEIENKEVMESLKNLIGSKVNVKGALKTNETKVIALVGPTGVGKTTTLAKLGWELHSMGKSVGFITTDTFRSGAKEQLEKFGEIMDAEVIVAKGSKVLKSGLKYFENATQVDHILIDTVGRNPMLEETSDAVKEYLDIAKPDLTLLVMSATAKVNDMKKTLERFSSVKIDGMVFTKLDETYNPGSVINVFNYTDIPLMYVANGQDVTQNLYAPTKENLVNSVLDKGEGLKGKIVV